MEKFAPCSPGDAGAIEMTWEDVDADKLLEPRLKFDHFLWAVRRSRPTVSQEDIEKSKEWTENFGSEGA